MSSETARLLRARQPAYTPSQKTMASRLRLPDFLLCVGERVEDPVGHCTVGGLGSPIVGQCNTRLGGGRGALEGQWGVVVEPVRCCMVGGLGSPFVGQYNTWLGGKRESAREASRGRGEGRGTSRALHGGWVGVPYCGIVHCPAGGRTQERTLGVGDGGAWRGKIGGDNILICLCSNVFCTILLLFVLSC